MPTTGIVMADHQALEEPDKFYLLSNRTDMGRYLFRPDRECRRIARGCLAWAADKEDVQLVAYTFISNHFHIVARFPDNNRAAFMRDFQSELSDRIKDHREDFNGTVFSENYHKLPLLDTESLQDAISYTVNNAVRHGLVTHPEAWPGVCSFENLRDAQPLVGLWLDCNKWHNLSRRKNPPPRRRAMVEHVVDLHLPECLPGEDAEERRQTLLEQIEADRKRFCSEAGIDRYTRPDKPSRYEDVDWMTTKPIEEEWCKTERTSRTCAANDPEAVENYIEKRRDIDERYRKAADKWKDGKKATFPAGTYPPGCAQPVAQEQARPPPD